MGRYPQRGKLDSLNCRETYPSLCAYDIPDVPSYEGTLPAQFIAWPNRKRSSPDDGLHMFVDDTRFEPVWSNVDRYYMYFDRIICGPDFSLHDDWPLAANLWNTYRTRWLTRALAARGVRVIPTVCWASPNTFGFCFQGLPQRSTVAVSAYGAKRQGAPYRAGFELMLQRLQPSRVLVIGGTMPDWMIQDYRVVYFPANTIADKKRPA